MLPHCPALLSLFSVVFLLLTLGKYMMMMMMMNIISSNLLDLMLTKIQVLVDLV